MKNLTISLPANGSQEVYQPGDFCRILESTGKVRVESLDGDLALGLDKGLAFRAVNGFKGLRLVDLSGVANTVELAIGSGEVFDSRLAGAVDVSGSTVDASGSTVTAKKPETSVIGGYVTATLAAGQSATMLSPNPSRKLLVVRNAPTSSAAVSIRNQTLYAVNGLWVYPGEALFLENYTGQVSVAETSGTGVAVVSMVEVS